MGHGATFRTLGRHRTGHSLLSPRQIYTNKQFNGYHRQVIIYSIKFLRIKKRLNLIIFYIIYNLY